MTAYHRKFELQCILASIGQLSLRRLEELRAHAANCEVCRNRLHEMAELNVLLSTALPKQHTSPAARNMTERFVVRAIREGIPLSHRPMQRSVRLAFALPMIILLAAIGVGGAWHLGEKESTEITSNSASLVSTGPPPGQARTTRLASESATPRPRAATRKRTSGKRSGREQPRQKLSNDAPSQGEFLSTNSAQRKWLVPGDGSGHSKFSERDVLAPALAAWLARQSSPPAWTSFNYSRNCDARRGFLSGDQLWPTREQDEVSRPPVFCFDPRIALIADSDLPEPTSVLWNRPLKDPSRFIVSAGAPAIRH